jgi:hypothetical protein
MFRETAWAPLQAQMARFREAQRLDWPACAERMDEVERRFEWNPLARLGTGFSRLLRRHRDGLLKLDVLICVTSASLARARHDPLSSGAAAICPPPQPTATCGEQSAPLRIVADAQGSRVSVTLSDGSDYSVLLAEPKK